MEQLHAHVKEWKNEQCLHQLAVDFEKSLIVLWFFAGIGGQRRELIVGMTVKVFLSYIEQIVKLF